MGKKLFFVVLLVAAVTGGAFILRSQQTREKKPPRPGTIRALVEKAPGTEVQLGKEIEYPTFESLDDLADSSEVVIHGEIVASRPFMCDQMRFVCTQFRVRVLEVLWGSIPDERRGRDDIPTFRPGVDARPQKLGPGSSEIVVTQPGGNLEVNGKQVRAFVADQHMLVRGGQYILFLKWIPATRLTLFGSETYMLTGGPQGGAELQDGRVRSLAPSYLPNHPIRFEVESLLQGNLGLFRSHFESRRVGRRP